MLWLKIFQIIWFCIEWADPLELGLGWPLFSGMFNILISSRRQLLTLVRCRMDNFTFCSTFTFFFRKSTKALDARRSVNATLIDASNLFISNIVYRPWSVFEMRSTFSKRSIGIVRFIKILIIRSKVLSSLACMNKGIMYFLMFWPIRILFR